MISELGTQKKGRLDGRPVVLTNRAGEMFRGRLDVEFATNAVLIHGSGERPDAVYYDDIMDVRET